MSEPLIAVSLNADGSVQYTLRTSLLDTKMYGIILATLSDYIAKMMEAEGGLNKEAVRAEIVRYFNSEVDKPTTPVSVHMVQ